jgi:hypothetical protein
MRLPTLLGIHYSHPTKTSTASAVQARRAPPPKWLIYPQFCCMAPTEWWRRLACFPPLVVRPFRWPVLRSGMIYRRKLRLRSYCRLWLKSSNSTCSICCGFVVQQVVQQDHYKSTTCPQLSTSPTTCTTNPQQIHYKSNKWSLTLTQLVYSKSTTIHNKSNEWSLSFSDSDSKFSLFSFRFPLPDCCLLV